jgi:hypothetical protein
MGPNPHGIPLETLLDEVARRLVAKVKAEEAEKKPSALTRRALRIREILLEALVSRTLGEMNAPQIPEVTGCA